ncbi:MAG TPA: hypothetical protein VK395_14860 [Gemmataceae bacterium]|nr:hypothetical protein [Gemmataceae bacterium]
MRRYLLCSGVHGQTRSLDWLKQAVDQRRPDGILFVGGILDPGRHCAVRTTPWSISNEDSLFVLKFFRTLGQLGVFSAVIPGPAGEPMEEFLRLGMQAELESPYVHVAHATLVEEQDTAICGIGGSIAERPLIGMDSYSRTQAEYFLRSLQTTQRPRKVLLLSAPPPGLLGGMEGNPLVGDLIDSLHPNLCVVGGSTERRGVAHVGRTTIVNPGWLCDGWAAWFDWDKPAKEQVEFLNLSAFGPEAHVEDLPQSFQPLKG